MEFIHHWVSQSGILVTLPQELNRLQNLGTGRSGKRRPRNENCPLFSQKEHEVRKAGDEGREESTKAQLCVSSAATELPSQLGTQLGKPPLCSYG